MKQMLLENCRTIFADSRETLKGRNEAFYQLTDYLSENINDEVTPEGLVLCISLAQFDIENEKNGFGRKMPEYLILNKKNVMKQFQYIPLLIDKVASPGYSKQVRFLFKKALHIDAPLKVKKQVKVSKKRNYQKVVKQEKIVKEECPECVVAAVNWWANAVLNPTFNNGVAEQNNMMSLLYSLFPSNISNEDIQKFKKELTKVVMQELKECGRCKLMVDYDPWFLLADVAKKFPNFTFPVKTSMNITYDSVVVNDYDGIHEIYKQETKKVSKK